MFICQDLLAYKYRLFLALQNIETVNELKIFGSGDFHSLIDLYQQIEPIFLYNIK